MPPMLATLTNDRTLLDRPDWLVERKFDGFRALAFRHGDSVKLLSRNRLDLGSKFPEVVQALTEQPIDQFVLDGEIVAFDRSRMSFQRLQQRLRPMDLERTRHTGVPVFYYIFDLLQVQGVDVRRQALIDRRRLLRQAIHFEGPLRLSVARKANPELLKRACHQGWEGLLVKARRSRYVAGRSREWLKLKCDSRQGSPGQPCWFRFAAGGVLR
jgi:bifunctional non-homologous end joining protein LigD